jgi:hypothetical protein
MWTFAFTEAAQAIWLGRETIDPGLDERGHTLSMITGQNDRRAE